MGAQEEQPERSSTSDEVALLAAAVAGALARAATGDGHALLEDVQAELPDGAALTSFERVKPGVYRLEAVAGGLASAFVGKLVGTDSAERISRLHYNWLPAVALASIAPIPYASAPCGPGDFSWQVYEVAPGRPVETGDAAAVDATVDLVAELHVRSAGQVDRFAAELPAISVEFYVEAVAAAVDALQSLELDPTGGIDDRLVGKVLDGLRRALEASGRRAQIHDDSDLPVVLLHGDLWPVNAMVSKTNTEPTVRLIDWDGVAVGPASYDLSTMLWRFAPTPEARLDVLGRYRDNVQSAGWVVPPPRTLDVLADTWEMARLALTLVWPARLTHDPEEAVRLSAIDELHEVGRWFIGHEPLFRKRS